MIRKFILVMLVVGAFAVVPAHAAKSGKTNIAVGIAADTNVTLGLVPSLTALFTVSEKTILQTYAQVVSTTPGFNFGLGANLKLTVAGDQDTGFHVGGGAGFGTTGGAAETFFVNINGIMGLHFHWAKRVVVHIDGGLSLNLTPAPVSFTLGGNSITWGATIAYEL